MAGKTKLQKKTDEAIKLGMEIKEETTEADIDAFLSENKPATEPADLVKKRGLARRLKVIFTDETSEKELDELIKEAEDRLEVAKKQQAILDANKQSADIAAKNFVIVLRNTNLEDVEQEDYFFPRVNDEKTFDGKILKATTKSAPVFFNSVCGMPVDDEDLINIFDSIIPKKKGFLFYKSRGKELYHVIVPLKYARTIGKHNDSISGDFQRHAMSFIGEGSTNPDALKKKLTMIYKHSDISDEPLF